MSFTPDGILSLVLCLSLSVSLSYLPCSICTSYDVPLSDVGLVCRFVLSDDGLYWYRTESVCIFICSLTHSLLPSAIHFSLCAISLSVCLSVCWDVLMMVVASRRKSRDVCSISTNALCIVRYTYPFVYSPLYLDRSACVSV